MTNSQLLRDEYLHRVCSALGEYLDRGLPMHLHSDGDSDTLEVTFTIDHPDTFHALIEGRTPPSSSSDGSTSTPVGSAK